MISTGKLVPIYVAVVDTWPPGTPEFESALDIVAGLSRLHGNFEVLYEAMVEGGRPRLQEELTWLIETRNLRSEFDIPALDGLESYTPDPGGEPFPPDWIGWPKRTPCELSRMACEAMLVEALNSDVPPPPPRTAVVYSDGIEYIEALGNCAGDKIILHGDFPSTQPEGVDVVVRVRSAEGEGCVPVEVDKWHKKRIEFKLPEGVRSGPIGFRDSDRLGSYNTWAEQ